MRTRLVQAEADSEEGAPLNSLIHLGAVLSPFPARLILRWLVLLGVCTVAALNVLLFLVMLSISWQGIYNPPLLIGSGCGLLGLLSMVFWSFPRLVRSVRFGRSA